jgi:hypothetical protein
MLAYSSPQKEVAMKRTMLFATAPICALVLFLTIASAAPPQQQSPDERYIGEQLTELTKELALGYAIVPDSDNYRRIGALWGGSTSAEIPYHLQAGTGYLFVGVCDKDCSDLNLTLYDRNGRVVAIEKVPARHDYPVFALAPRETGTYYLRATMAGCRTNGCYFGVDIYRKAQ